MTTVTGVVVDGVGQGVAGVGVELRAQRWPTDIFRARTLRDGRFAVEVAPVALRYGGQWTARLPQFGSTTVIEPADNIRISLAAAAAVHRAALDETWQSTPDEGIEGAEMVTLAAQPRAEFSAHPSSRHTNDRADDLLPIRQRTLESTTAAFVERTIPKAGGGLDSLNGPLPGPAADAGEPPKLDELYAFTRRVRSEFTRDCMVRQWLS